MKMEFKSSVSVVLVEAQDNANIGSVARAMMNLGFSRLVLVNPERYDFQRASITACWATDILKSAKIESSLSEAIRSEDEVVGFSARRGKNRPSLMLPEWIEILKGKRPSKLSLVFGPEDTGLREEHIEHCSWLVQIPSSEECPSFNLAQAVLIALYEISRIGWKSLPARDDEGLASWSDYENLDEMVKESAELAGFINSNSPQQIPQLITNIFRRTRATNREMAILQGIFGKIRQSLKAGSGKR